MGISGLIPFLCKHLGKDVRVPKHINNFRGRTVAVDLYGFLHKFKFVNAKAFYDSVVHLICSLKNARMTPIIVIDGGSPPEKKKERERRSEAKNKIEDRYTQLRVAIEKYEESGEISDILREEMKGCEEVPSLVHKRPEIDIRYLRNKMNKLDQQAVKISSEEIDNIMKLLSLLGVNTILAPDEGERHACALVAGGVADCVMANDSDVLAYGIGDLLYDFQPYTKEVKHISSVELCKDLGLTQAQFRDFCIMCGTDYNSNIPNYGPVKAMGLIKKHYDIDGLAKAMDVSILNHVRVRELFTPVPVKHILKFATPDLSGAHQLLIKLNCRVMYKTLEEAFRECEIILED